MSTVEGVRELNELGSALSQVQDQLDRLRRSAARHPNAFVSPGLYERYEAKLAALRWLVGEGLESPVTKAASRGVPTASEVVREATAAEAIRFPGHRRGEPPAGIPSYEWLGWVQRTLHWALGWKEEPHPASG